MASNDNVKIYIVGDASGVAPAVAKTEGALGGLEPILAELNSQIGRLTAQMRGFHRGRRGREEARGRARGGQGRRRRHWQRDRAMVARIHEGAESVRTFQMRAKAFAEAYVAMFAVERSPNSSTKWARPPSGSSTSPSNSE
jgi:hypothetical protein